MEQDPMEIKGEAVSEKEKQEENPVVKKQWIGRGIYGKGDVPIRILDGLIGLVFVTIIALVVIFALNGGFYVHFETDGGSEVESQKLGYGEYAQVPEVPVKPGYEFVEWVTSQDEFLAEPWDFSENKIEGEMTLYAVWKPAQVTVKFDLNGGQFPEGKGVSEKQVVYGEAYGELPVPEKDGYVFDGWEYSRQIIKDDTTVFMTGEHILTARWAVRQ